MTSPGLSELAVLLIFAGFALAFLAVIVMLAGSVRGGGRVRGGGVILLGPIPIILGTDKASARWLIALGLILTLLLIVLWILPLLR